MAAPRLTEHERYEIVRRYARGEKVAAIAADYTVSISYPGLLALRRGRPLRVDDARRAQMRDAARRRLVKP